jgi:hypothetical protein
MVVKLSHEGEKLDTRKTRIDLAPLSLEECTYVKSHTNRRIYGCVQKWAGRLDRQTGDCPSVLPPRTEAPAGP